MICRWSAQRISSSRRAAVPAGGDHAGGRAAGGLPVRSGRPGQHALHAPPGRAGVGAQLRGQGEAAHGHHA